GHTPLALLEERAERRQIIPPGLQRNRVNVIPPEDMRELRLALVDKVANMRARRAIGRVDFNLIASFGVLQSDDADVRQRLFPLIVNTDRDKIVPSPAPGERSREIRRLKIRDKKDHCAACNNLIQIIECQRRFRTASLRLKKQNLTNKTQGMRPTFFRRNKKLNAICEKNEANLVVVPNGAESEQAGDLCGQFTLGLRNASEISGCANIDNEHHSKLALLCKFFYKSCAQTGGHVPVDRANFIARLVFAHIFKIHSTALKDTMVITRESGFDQTARLDLERPDLFENLSGVHE